MVSSNHLKPGEKGKITARVDTNRRRGILVKTADVLSNDPQKPKVTLTLKANIREPVPPVPSPQR